MSSTINNHKKRKTINFDLSTSELRKMFGYLGTAKAYGLIKKFMLEHGFEHRQYSGYISKNPMSFIQVEDIIKKMSIEYSWLHKVIEKMDEINEAMRRKDAKNEGEANDYQKYRGRKTSATGGCNDGYIRYVCE